MRDGHFDRHGLADIVKALSIHVEAGVEWAITFTNTAWESLLAEPLLSDDLRPLCLLVKNLPDDLPEGTMERVEQAIRSVAKSVASGDWDLDADGLREEAESLESLSKDVGIDITDDLSAIRERANELEEESGRGDEHVDFSSSSSRKGEFVGDDEIASIFSMLEVTI